MDCEKIGQVILSLRKEKQLTQKQLGDLLHVSDKTISKWECGLGCPDVSLLQQLSGVLKVNLEQLLTGDMEPNDRNGGNMKRIQFYQCPVCGNLLTATGEADISCCGRKLEAMPVKKSDTQHHLNVETIEDDYYITFEHEMTKVHYISFVAYVCCDRILIVKLYPEQEGQVRFHKMHGGKFYFGCNQHGVWVNS